MNLLDLKQGDRIKIGTKTYEVLFLHGEMEVGKPKNVGKRRLRPYTNIALHDNKSKELSPTHHLTYYYEDTKEIFLIETIKKSLKEKDIEKIK